MNNTTQKNEGMWDRLSAGFTGLKTGAQNIGTAVSSVASGVPLKLTNVQDAKIKQLFSLAQSRIKPFVKKLNSNNIDTKLTAEIEVKKQLLGFIRDFMKMTGEKKPNNVIATLQQPQYAQISDYLKKIGVVNSTSPKSTPIPATTSSTTSSTSPASAVPVPKDGALDITKGYKFDASKGLWIDIKANKPLSKSESNSKTIAYWSAVNAKKIVPEGVSKITYKEFFV